MPNQRMKSGSSAILGIGNSADDHRQPDRARHREDADQRGRRPARSRSRAGSRRRCVRPTRRGDPKLAARRPGRRSPRRSAAGLGSVSGLTTPAALPICQSDQDRGQREPRERRTQARLEPFAAQRHRTDSRGASRRHLARGDASPRSAATTTIDPRPRPPADRPAAAPRAAPRSGCARSRGRGAATAPGSRRRARPPPTGCG